MTQLSFQDFLIEEQYYSVSDLTKEIKYLLETSFREIWLHGEISNFNHHMSGHMYFSLKDENAQINCAMWRSRNYQLFFTPQDGMKVLVLARLNVYEKKGSYQLNVLQMKPAGLGELQLAFEHLKRKLQAEGLFSEEHKRSIPAFPECVGIVTSETGAALRDIVTVMRRRFPAIQIILNAVRVQGENAADEIAQAIAEFNDYKKVDVIIVARGGGSLEDLWAFNEERVARAVFKSKIPVVSAIGHEVDFTICDFVADLRAPTPSVAGELIVPNRVEILSNLNTLHEHMTDTMLSRIANCRERIFNIVNGYVFRRPQDFVLQCSQRVDELGHNLRKAIEHQTKIQKQQLDNLSKRLTLLEHNNVLKRGYALCFSRSDGKLISDAGQLREKEGIELEFYQGKVFGTVDEVFTEKGDAN